MRAVGYCRVSSQEQTEGTSLKAQEDQIRAYAAMKEIEIVAVMVDAGVSGGKPLADRPEGGKLAQMVRTDEVEAVIITKLDRGFRSASDCLNCVEEWEKKDVSLHILNLGGTTIDSGTPTGKFFITIMAGAAELERNMIRERCNEGRKIRRGQGCRVGEVPFGYSLGTDGRALVENSEEQEALSLIHSLKAKGRSLRVIADELNRRQLKAKKGGT